MNGISVVYSATGLQTSTMDPIWASTSSNNWVVHGLRTTVAFIPLLVLLVIVMSRAGLCSPFFLVFDAGDGRSLASRPSSELRIFPTLVEIGLLLQPWREPYFASLSVFCPGPDITYCSPCRKSSSLCIILPVLIEMIYLHADLHFCSSSVFKASVSFILLLMVTITCLLSPFPFM